MIIDQKTMLKVFNFFKPIFSKSSPMIESACLFFTEKEIIGFDDVLYISTVNNTGIRGVLKAKELVSFLTSLGDAEVTLKQTSSKCSFVGKNFKTSFNFFDLDVIQLPEIIDTPKEIPSDFVSVISKCYPIINPISIRPATTCVNITKDFAVATDNFRIIKIPFQKKNPCELLMPYKVAACLGNYNFTEVIQGENRTVFIDDENALQLSFPIFDEEFPDVGPVLNFTGTKIVFPDDFVDGIARNTLFMNDKQQLDITIKKGEISCVSYNEAGKITTSGEIDYQGELEFSIRHSFFINLLKYSNTVLIGDGKAKVVNDQIELAVALIG